jgi:putative intracellular protease/amidase
MNWSRLCTLVGLVSLALPSLQPASAQTGKVLLIAKDGESADLDYILTHEVGVMTSMLEEAGFEVVVASPSGQSLAGEEHTLTPDLSLAEVSTGEFDGIIMPCMAMEEEAQVPALEALIKETVAAGKPVAAQLGSVVQLARAGVLDGKKFAYVEEWIPNVPELAGLDYGGPGVVEEGNVISSGVCPWAAQALDAEDTTTALTSAFIGRLKGE